MRTKKHFIFLSASIVILLLFSARTINAQKNQYANGNGRQNQFGLGNEHGSYMNQFGLEIEDGSFMNRFGQGIDNGYSMFRYGRENDGTSYGYQYNRGFENYSYGGPRWIMDPDNFPGMGPYWYRTDPAEGIGPWFKVPITIEVKESTCRLAPPTKAPSMSGCFIKLSVLSGLTLPPY